MAEVLADLFAAERSPTIVWDGAVAYAVWEVTPVPEELAIEFLSAAAAPIQGLAVKIDGGMLRVNGEEAKHITLWQDTAPRKVRVVIAKKGKAKLSIWNIWREAIGGHDVTQAWLGNFGMRIEQSDDENETILRCSDGVGSVDFDNLVVSVKAVSPA
ncbi:hypothetical protein [Brevundimonas sp. FT23042]|uniref:hypothetical protein n=1 Tax=Brevundimonas sp. FT23042 TaxID=3393749 RepID=UPI003B5897C9